MDITQITARQRAFFETGATRPVKFRAEALKRLKAAVISNEDTIFSALKEDLNKSPGEAYMCEVGMVLEEIGYALKHLRAWAKDRPVPTPLAQFWGRSVVSPQPYGLALIMAPWNYPVQLCLCPLVSAIAAGNCAVVKPSAYAPCSSRAVAKIISEAFPPEHAAAVEGGRAENSRLLDTKFDCIFFTGSVAVGKKAMEAAARHLTPITLELGGKSPVIVDSTADIPLAARRVAFGKILNAGQTCVAPDYVLIQKSVKDAFVSAYREALSGFFPGGDYSRMASIVSEKHFLRIKSLMEGQKLLLGGDTDPARRFIRPALVDQPAPDSPIMEQEIFGPLLPVITFSGLDEAISFVNARPRPLALYLFTSSKETERRVLGSCSFGGGCVNDTIVHLATPYMAFGGVGDSGMGSCHGRAGFDTFTHQRSIMKKSTLTDLPLRYPPFTDKKLGLIRLFLK